MGEVDFERYVTLSRAEFYQMVSAVEKLDVIKRFYTRNEYLSDSDLRTILDIPEKKKEED